MHLHPWHRDVEIFLLFLVGHLRYFWSVALETEVFAGLLVEGI